MVTMFSSCSSFSNSRIHASVSSLFIMLLSLTFEISSGLIEPPSRRLQVKEFCERLCLPKIHSEGVPAPKPFGGENDWSVPKICPTPTCPKLICPDLPSIPDCPPCPSPCPAIYPNASYFQTPHCPKSCPIPICPPPMCPSPRCPTPVCPEPRCPGLQCPAAPRIPPCPPAVCPEPVCPQPRCPPPVCPKTNCASTTCPSQHTTLPCPTCPECPKITPNIFPSGPKFPKLECPTPICPEPRCPNCPKIPEIPACPTCPTPTCPTPVCMECSKDSTRRLQERVTDSCSSCLWKVLVTYDHFPGFGFYKAYNFKLTWHEANTTCTNDGGHLAIINSQEEADILKLLFQKNQMSGWIHIGFHDLLHEGQYTTVLGQPLSKSGYVKWLPGQPDNRKNNEDCGTIEYRALLNDGNCKWRVGFICEVPEKDALRQ